MVRQGKTLLHSPAVWMPDELEAAWNLKQQHGEEACFIAGGTLLQTQWEKGKKCPRNIISLERITQLQGFGKELVDGKTMFRIGALTSLDVCRNHPELLKDVPLLSVVIRNIAAPAIRNKATIGGNIASGIGDSIPAFLVMDSLVSFFDGREFQLKTVADWLKMGNLSNSILISVYLPEVAVSQECYFFHKVGHREAFSPSIVTIAGCCQLSKGKEVEYVRLAVGSTATPAKRLVASEQLLMGDSLSNDLLKKVFQKVFEEFVPEIDAFSSEEYKRLAAANMIVSEIARLAGSVRGTG